MEVASGVWNPISPFMSRITGNYFTTAFTFFSGMAAIDTHKA
jgi:hypothetical protein